MKISAVLILVVGFVILLHAVDAKRGKDKSSGSKSSRSKSSGSKSSRSKSCGSGSSSSDSDEATTVATTIPPTEPTTKPPCENGVDLRTCEEQSFCELFTNTVVDDTNFSGCPAGQICCIQIGAARIPRV